MQEEVVHGFDVFAKEAHLVFSDCGHASPRTRIGVFQLFLLPGGNPRH
jgi:hypothetical protein